MEYTDEDDNGLCDWCGEPDHGPAQCVDMLDKGVDTLRRAADKRKEMLQKDD